MDTETGAPTSHVVHLPAPTAWPIVLALGITLLFAGLVTSMGNQHSGTHSDGVRFGWLVPECSAARAA